MAGEATFVAMIARRRLVDRFRRSSRRKAAEPLDGVAGPPAPTGRPPPAPNWTDEAARASEAMKQLSAAQI